MTQTTKAQHWSSPLCERPGDRCGQKHMVGTKHDDSAFTKPAPQVVAERGSCQPCGILGAPKFYYDVTRCRSLGHDVREVGK